MVVSWLLNMLSVEFSEKLEKFPSLKRFYDGTCSSDTIPKSLKKDHFIICNTDLSTGPGQHWYCVLKTENNTLECFDSLGIDHVKKEFLRNNFNFHNIDEIEYNVTSLQPDDSISCGHYVLFFLIQRSHNKDLDFTDFLNEIFTVSKTDNEKVVEQFFKDHF